jgi:hypothetical protein
MRWLVAVRWFAGIVGIAAALLTSAPAQADRGCPGMSRATLHRYLTEEKEA